MLSLTPSAFAAEPPTTLPPTELLARYDAVRIALNTDQLDDARSRARELAAVDAGDLPVAGAASTIALSPDINAARIAFSELSRAFVLELAETQKPPRVSVYFCPMWSGYAWWVQPKAGLANPYMGQAMSDCGEEISLKAAAKAAKAPA